MDQWLDLIEVFPDLNDSEIEEEGKKWRKRRRKNTNNLCLMRGRQQEGKI